MLDLSVIIHTLKSGYYNDFSCVQFFLYSLIIYAEYFGLGNSSVGMETGLTASKGYGRISHGI